MGFDQAIHSLLLLLGAQGEDLLQTWFGNAAGGGTASPHDPQDLRTQHLFLHLSSPKDEFWLCLLFFHLPNYLWTKGFI